MSVPFGMKCPWDGMHLGWSVPRMKCILRWSELGDAVTYWIKCHLGCSAFFPSGWSDIKKVTLGWSTGEPKLYRITSHLHPYTIHLEKTWTKILMNASFERWKLNYDLSIRCAIRKMIQLHFNLAAIWCYERGFISNETSLVTPCNCFDRFLNFEILFQNIIS